MIMVVFFVFGFLSQLLGYWLAGILSIILFILWGRFNMSQSTIGLFRSNLKMYFSALKQGMSKDEAINKMIRTRMIDETEIMMVFNSTELQMIFFDEPDADVKKLVFAIFCAENGIPPTKTLVEQYARNLEDVYSNLLAKHNEV